MAGEKTEKATPKRKKDERKKGNIFQSQEVVVVFTLLVSFFSLKFLGPYIVKTLENSIKTFLDMSISIEELTAPQLRKLFLTGGQVFLVTSMPILLICGFAAIIATVAQTKGLFTMKAVSVKFSRMDPIQGIKKLFSIRGIVELLKSLLKIIILGYIIYSLYKKDIGTFPKMMSIGFGKSMAITGNMILDIAKNSALIMAFVAVADYAYQWWEYEKNLRMSKQELKEEYKQTEGDPQVKGKIREKQQAQARKRMMQQVPSADVVIRNPTHFAVAIKYDPERNNAPVVVAKGADELALRIVKVAEDNDVYITENRPLARGLYENVDLDAEIPESFYKPVAEILAFVYNLKNKKDVIG